MNPSTKRPRSPDVIDLTEELPSAYEHVDKKPAIVLEDTSPNVANQYAPAPATTVSAKTEDYHKAPQAQISCLKTPADTRKNILSRCLTFLRSDYSELHDRDFRSVYPGASVGYRSFIRKMTEATLMEYQDICSVPHFLDISSCPDFHKMMALLLKVHEALWSSWSSKAIECASRILLRQFEAACAQLGQRSHAVRRHQLAETMDQQITEFRHLSFEKSLEWHKDFVNKPDHEKLRLMPLTGFDESDGPPVPSFMGNTTAQSDVPANPEDFRHFLDELQAEELAGDEGTNTAQEVMEAAKSIGATPLPDGKYQLPGLICSLHPHQVIGVAWMTKRERRNDDDGARSKVRGGLLADAMGLGKTVQTIGVMIKNQPLRETGPTGLSQLQRKRLKARKPFATLIICPVALVHQWAREIERKAPGVFSKIRVHHGANKIRTLAELKRYDVVITSYGTVTREYPIRKHRKRLTDAEKAAEEMRIERDKGILFRVQFHRIILDEAHTIKNPAANWCLTGTPLQNKVDDIFPILAVLQVPYFQHRPTFRQEFKNTQEGATKLRGILAPFLKRRNKDDRIAGEKVLTLPKKTVTMQNLTLDDDERALYKQVESQMVNQINKFLQDGTAVKKISHIFIMVLRLRQLCIHPYLILDHLATKAKFDRTEFVLGGGGMRSFMDLFSGLNDMEGNIICGICSEESIATVISLQCRHTFCSDCVSETYEDEETLCPVCQQALGRLVKFSPTEHTPADNCEIPSNSTGPAARPSAQSLFITRAVPDIKPNVQTIASTEPSIINRETGISAVSPFTVRIKQESLCISSDEDDQAQGGAIPKRLFGSSSAVINLDSSDEEELPSLDIKKVCSVIKREIIPQVKNEVRIELNPAVDTCVKSEVKSEFKSEIKSEFKSEVKSEVKTEVKSQAGKSGTANSTLAKTESAMNSISSQNLYHSPKTPVRMPPHTSSLNNLTNNAPHSRTWPDNTPAPSISFQPARLHSTPNNSNLARAASLVNQSSILSRLPRPESANAPPAASASAAPPSSTKKRYSADLRDVEEEQHVQTKEEKLMEEENWRQLLKLEFMPSTKMTAAEEQLQKWMAEDDSKIIVFSQFVKALDLLARVCQLNDWDILRYQGSMNMKEREETIAMFEEPQGPRVLLMSLKAGGVGLNLVCASKVLLMDFWWNASQEHQAIDRCHRMGQLKEVHVIRTFFPDTVEEKILALQDAKLQTAGMVLGEEEGGGKMPRMGLNELMGLFGRVTRDEYGVQQIETR